jgi:hypothetical protein
LQRFPRSPVVRLSLLGPKVFPLYRTAEHSRSYGAIDRAVDVLYRYTEFKTASKKFYLLAIEGNLTILPKNP